MESFLPLYSVAGLLGIWWLWFPGRDGYLHDRFRQDMFALRDQLFDTAQSGLVSFDDPSYRMLSDKINQFIRFAHRIDFWSFMVSILLFRPLMKDNVPNMHQEWLEVSGHLTGDAKKRMDFFFMTMQAHVFKKFLLSSLLTLLAISILVSLAKVSKGIMQTKKKFTSQTVDNLALTLA